IDANIIGSAVADLKRNPLSWSDRVEWIVTPISKAKDMLEAAEEIREVSVEGERLLCRMNIASISNWNKHFVENEIDVHSVK
ncbi:hypothetical protein ACT453_55890, partial [Bacillus sp. D-CC]